MCSDINTETQHLPVAKTEMLPSTWPNATLSRCCGWHLIWQMSDENPLISLWLAKTRFWKHSSVLNHSVSGPRFPMNAMPEGFGIPHAMEHGIAIPSRRVTFAKTCCSATFQIITARSAPALTITSTSCGHQAIAVIAFLCSDCIECNRYSRDTASHCNKDKQYHGLTNIWKLAPYGIDGRLFITDVSAKFKVTWHKNYDKYKKSGLIKFRHCALV